LGVRITHAVGPRPSRSICQRAKAATSTIPIVFVVAADPVEFKLVDSLSRPGGNATGISYLNYELGGKRLGLLRELMPEVARVAVVAKPSSPPAEIFIRGVGAAARTLGLQIDVLYASAERDFDTVFATLTERRLEALLVATDPLFTVRRFQIVALAARHHVPAIYGARE
jgi:putative tryptophan/tyrosine transport system substrate-binding protein